jgi:uncharacterized membrane protein YfcA
MVFTDIIFSFLIAILITSLFVGVKYRKERRIWEKRIWPLFVVIFLATWATSIWITPSGLVPAQYAWFPMLVAGIILAVVVATFLPAEGEKDIDKEEKTEQVKRNMKSTNTWFWVLIFILIIPIVLGYFLH